MLGGLDALCDGVDVEGAGHLDQRGDEQGVAATLAQLGDEKSGSIFSASTSNCRRYDSDE